MTTDLPLVSIIIITYNSSKYVLETLESAKSQTYQNIELIISDDGSQDDTIKLCEMWLAANKERFVRSQIVTVEKNTGIPANCNRGLKASRGAWVKLIAGDDILLNNCVADNINFVSLNDSKIVLSKVQLFSIEHDKIILKEVWTNKTDFYKLDSLSQYKQLLKSDKVSVTPSVFIYNDLIKALNYYDEEFKLIEDYPFWLKATKNGNKLFLMDRITVKYRIHENSVCQGKLIETSLNNEVSMRNEALREKYIYPNYTLLGKYSHKYIWLVRNLFKNKRNNQFNRFLLNQIFLKLLNPFSYLIIVLQTFFPTYEYELKKNIQYSNYNSKD